VGVSSSMIWSGNEEDESHSAAWKSDGTAVVWGDNDFLQCNVPAPNADFVKVVAGMEHTLGLKADGTIAAWGSNAWGQCDVPAPNADFVDVDAGQWHSVGLRSDGSIAVWGSCGQSRCEIPLPNAGFVAVDAGDTYTLGLRSDGSVAAWGLTTSGRCDVPAPNTGFVAVSAGWGHSLGLKSDGSIVAWGSNGSGQCNVPLPNADFIAVSAGGGQSLGLKSDGSIAAWGSNTRGQCDVPEPNSGFIAISAGYLRSLAIRGTEEPVATLVSSFVGRADGNDVVLSWDIASDDDVRGFVIYRGAGGDGRAVTDRPLPPEARVYRDPGLRPGVEYEYRLAVLLGDGREIPSAPVSICIAALALELEANYPNPFNPSTTISFTLPERGDVELSIYDVAGRRVRTLAREVMDAGRRTVVWDGRDDAGRRVNSGVYFCRLRADRRVLTQKLVVVK